MSGRAVERRAWRQVLRRRLREPRAVVSRSPAAREYTAFNLRQTFLSYFLLQQSSLVRYLERRACLSALLIYWQVLIAHHISGSDESAGSDENTCPVAIPL